ncbi:MAG TPA: hypothetical protein V6C57_04500 [Coleofasciculaceae cyanobacterium]
MKLPVWILAAIALATSGSVALAEIAIAETPETPAADNMPTTAPTTVPTTVPTAATATAPVPAPLPEITSAQFNQMQLGMTVAQVTTVLGRSGTVGQNWTEANSGTAAYQWQLQDSDRIVQVVFYNGRVVGRTAWTMPVEALSPVPAPVPPNPVSSSPSSAEPQ